MTTNPILMKAGLLLVGLHLTVVSTAQAGGGAYLDLPVTGLTNRTGPQLIEQLSSGLEPKLGKHGKVTLPTAGRDGTVRILLGWNRILTLDDVDEALKGSEFRVDRNQLQFFGAIRLEVKGIDDLDALKKALFPEGSEHSFFSRNGAEATTVLTITSARRGQNALFTHRELQRIMGEQGGQLTSINWGNTDALGVTEAENTCFHCRDPYGARRLERTALTAK